MQFLDLVQKRQSCRGYDSRPVSRDLVEKCIEAARLAPSACNSQPWHFIVVDSDPLRLRLAEAAFGGIYSMNKFALTAPVLVVMRTESSKTAARLGGQFRGVQYNLIDIGIAGAHFDLQAAELGLGCCWLGWFDEKAVKRTLGLPRFDRIDVVFSLGYPQEECIRGKKRKAFEAISSFVGMPGNSLS